MFIKSPLLLLLTILMVSGMDENKIWGREVDNDYTECDDSENIKLDVNLKRHQGIEADLSTIDPNKFTPNFVSDTYNPELEVKVDDTSERQYWRLDSHSERDESGKEPGHWIFDPLGKHDRN